MSQDALGQLKHLKTARARWPFPDAFCNSSLDSPWLTLPPTGREEMMIDPHYLLCELEPQLAH